jgi:diguanylate cyclase (GGDEF)-like protein
VLDPAADELLARVLASGRGEVASDAEQLGEPLFAALGRPARVALEPVVGQGVTGVLVLAVHEPVERRRETLALLAAEAASAIGRADVVAELESLARIDPLTGLPNRRGWEEALSRAVAVAARDGMRVSVAVLDLDAFKQFNDTQGHQAGDRALEEVAAAWRRELRDGDVLARWGGDEFALLVTAPRAEAERVVDRLRASLPQQPFSAGVAELESDDNADRVLARADAELYAAKARRRGQDE